jgi:hypothetical protein
VCVQAVGRPGTGTRRGPMLPRNRVQGPGQQVRSDCLTQHPVYLALREIRHDMGSRVAGARRLVNRRWPWHAGEHRCLRGLRLASPSPAETGTIGVIAWAAADAELIHLDRAIERPMVAPCRWPRCWGVLVSIPSEALC